MAKAVHEVLDPLGVAVVVECAHMCMVMRGVQKAGAVTVTQCKMGIFRDDARLDDRFHVLLDMGRH